MKSRRRCATKTGDGWWWLLDVISLFIMMMCISRRRSVCLKQQKPVPIPTGRIMFYANTTGHGDVPSRKNTANQSVTMLARLSCNHSIYLRLCRTTYNFWSKTEMLTASWQGHWNNSLWQSNAAMDNPPCNDVLIILSHVYRISHAMFDCLRIAFSDCNVNRFLNLTTPLANTITWIFHISRNGTWHVRNAVLAKVC